MKILVIGESIHFRECQKKLGSSHGYTLLTSLVDAKTAVNDHEVIFDFITDDSACFEIYIGTAAKVFLNTSKKSLKAWTNGSGHERKSTVFGFNGLTTLFDRHFLEVSVLQKTDIDTLDWICKKLHTEYRLVDDQVGLVTPRVISMIINEAYYTVQEGTASREDIDLAMKLGTNYPYGPFEWCQRIGVKNVYELLQAIYEDTKDERYRICALLEEEYARYKSHNSHSTINKK